MAKKNSALINNLKFFLSATRATPGRMWEAHDVRQSHQLYRKKEKNIQFSQHKV